MTAWVEEIVPAARLTEGMAVISTGITAGVAPGAVLAGTVIDAAGAGPSYWVAAGSGGVAVLCALLTLGGRPVTAAAASPSGSSG
jgi:predicted MFS family arabinose efflux permease